MYNKMWYCFLNLFEWLFLKSYFSIIPQERLSNFENNLQSGLFGRRIERTCLRGQFIGHSYLDLKSYTNSLFLNIALNQRIGKPKSINGSCESWSEYSAVAVYNNTDILHVQTHGGMPATHILQKETLHNCRKWNPEMDMMGQRQVPLEKKRHNESKFLKTSYKTVILII